jgi:histone H3/H4
VKVVKRKVKGVVSEYSIYTKDEADDLGIQYKPWREAKVLEYIITDDAYVCQLIGTLKYEHQNGHIYEILIFPFKRILLTKSSKLLYTQKPDWVTQEMRRGRTKLVVKLFAQQLIEGHVDYEMLGKLYRPDQRIPEATVKRLFRQERIQNMVKEEIRKELGEVGLDAKYVLKTMKKAIEIAESKDDAGNMLRGAADLSELLDLKPEKQTSSIQWSMTGDKALTQLDASMEVAEKALNE